jgi:hypothetical protein
VDPSSPAFDSPDAAADAVSKDFGKQQNVEQAAIILKHKDGSYHYSTVAPQKDHDSFSLKVAFPKEYSIAGVVHSHPGNDDLAGMFSPRDLDVADQLKVPSFIRFLKDNSIRKYIPGKTRTDSMRQTGSMQQIRTARGDALEPQAPVLTADMGPAPAGGLLSQAAQMSNPSFTPSPSGVMQSAPN